MKAIVLLNGKAGAGASVSTERDAKVAAALSRAGIDATIRLVPGEQLQDEARAAVSSGIDVVVAGGGDGTISAVAGALVESDIPLGVLPLGTLNHFAKDLGISLDLDEAAQTIASRRIATIDVGVVNERVFINNSSIGLYPRLVLDRDKERKLRGIGKWPAMSIAFARALWRFPLLDVTLDTDQGEVTTRTPLVMVGNNAYQMDLLNIGGRACLDAGCLSLYVAHVESRWGIMKLIFHAFTGRLKQARDFDSYCLSRCTIQSRRPMLHVSADGEVTRLESPLHYSIKVRSLRVFAPEQAASKDETILEANAR